MLAAIETGQTVDVADVFYEGLLKSNDNDVLDEYPDGADPQAPAGGEECPIDGRTLIQRAFAACPALLPALQAAREKRDGRSVTAGECLVLARDVRRYSFNRYQ